MCVGDTGIDLHERPHITDLCVGQAHRATRTIGLALECREPYRAHPLLERNVVGHGAFPVIRVAAPVGERGVQMWVIEAHLWASGLLRTRDRLRHHAVRVTPRLTVLLPPLHRADAVLCRPRRPAADGAGDTTPL